MEPSSCDYHYMCSFRCGKSNEILHHSWATKDTIVQWLRLLPKMEGFSHPLPTYERCLKTFICCGWAHGSIIMPLPPYVLTQIWEVSWNHVVVVEALTQHGMVPTSPPNIYQALDNIHMLWIGTAINLNAITNTNTCVNPDVGSPLKFHITAV